MRYTNRVRAEAAAYDILAKHGDGKLPVAVAPAVTACCRARVMTYGEAVEALGMDEGEFYSVAASDAAFIVKREAERGAEFLLLTSGKCARARERFSMAHELGHIVLAHSADDRASETEANVFASAFLCPRPILRAIGLRRAEDVAAAFDISLAAANIALEDARRIAHEDAALYSALKVRFDVDNRHSVEDYMDFPALARFYTARLGYKKRPSVSPRRADRDMRVDSAIEDMERLIEIRMA